VGNVGDNSVRHLKHKCWPSTHPSVICVELLGGDSRQPMTGRLATHHSSTTVLISKILIHASVYQYSKYQSHKSTGRSKTKTTSSGGESMGSGGLQTTIGLSLSTSTDIRVSHQTRRLRCQVHTQLSSVSSLFYHTNAIYKYTHTFAHTVRCRTDSVVRYISIPTRGS